MKYSKTVESIISDTIDLARKNNHEYITPEHLLYVITFNEDFQESYIKCGGDILKLRVDLQEFIFENIDSNNEVEPELSYSFREVLNYSKMKASTSDRETIELTHILDAIMNLEESYGSYFMLSQGIEWTSLLYEICNDVNEEDIENKKEDLSWIKEVVCLNDIVHNNEPLIGREEEINRTMQILCRKYKNNPIHVGEPGVGKTAITYGLIKLINNNRVPDTLKGAKVFLLDIGRLISGTQYRGDFEKKFKKVMDGLAKLEKPIVYIDEIHNIVGAGSISGGSLDASNMLKPYLTEGRIRVIGATTYDEYNKYFAQNKSLARRFLKVDIKEPTIEESIKILNGLKGFYEEHHKVKFNKGTIEHAINLSNKYINDKYLPDKAIDLIDEAAAYRVLNPLNQKTQTIDKKLIEEVLAKTCNIPKETVEKDEIKKLASLNKELKKEVFGQDEAIDEIVNAIKLSRAGLNDDNKPVANFLFVGPTGVGKTEIAKCLSRIMNIKLIRFDMSEYVEKHSVSKLIGSPAGYVGYEEGGLLTDEVRKNPYCILLLDEIEKAHKDIFNILLQVMDYATLTDNKGRKTDFKNVILIMTSNAGASSVNKNLIGFGERRITEGAITEAVKKIFTPEFRNRISKTIIFSEIDSNMANKIVEKNLNNLKTLLKEKNINISFSKGSIKYLRDKGISREFGGREVGRLIDKEIKGLLVNEILFGNLKRGGNCLVDYKDNRVLLKVNE